MDDLRLNSQVKEGIFMMDNLLSGLEGIFKQTLKIQKKMITIQNDQFSDDFEQSLTSTDKVRRFE